MQSAGRLPVDLRLAVRFPQMSDALLAAALRLPLGSELRRRIPMRGFAQGFDMGREARRAARGISQEAP
jgi:hypothetical protein